MQVFFNGRPTRHSAWVGQGEKGNRTKKVWNKNRCKKGEREVKGEIVIAGLWFSNHRRVWSGSPKGGGGGVVRRWGNRDQGAEGRVVTQPCVGGRQRQRRQRRWVEKNPGQHGGSRDEILPGGAEGKTAAIEEGGGEKQVPLAARKGCFNCNRSRIFRFNGTKS